MLSFRTEGAGKGGNCSPSRNLGTLGSPGGGSLKLRVRTKAGYEICGGAVAEPEVDFHICFQIPELKFPSTEIRAGEIRAGGKRHKSSCIRSWLTTSTFSKNSRKGLHWADKAAVRPFQAAGFGGGSRRSALSDDPFLELS